MEEFTQKKAFLYKVLVIEFSFFVKGVGWDRAIESVFTFPPPAFGMTNHVGRSSANKKNMPKVNINNNNADCKT